jgi:hypothetical protein
VGGTESFLGEGRLYGHDGGSRRVLERGSDFRADGMAVPA